MTRAAVAAAHALLALGGLALGVELLFALTFGLRNAACVPGYVALLNSAGADFAAGAALALTPAAALAAWGLAGHRLRWTLSLGPQVAVLLATGLFVSADAVLVHANAVHCAAGTPGTQDNTLTVPLASSVLARGAAVAALIAPVAAVTATIALFRHAQA